VSHRITYGVGAHEPIFHRMRTGNATAEEWDRWEQETSVENLDLSQSLGVSHCDIACTKGFGLEYEKPLIERAARFAEAAAERGMTTSIYVQGFPVYYETFLIEIPQAEAWLGRQQDGDYIPWGSQTFRRWMEPACEAFHEYQWRLLEYVLAQFAPVRIAMDNTVPPPSWTDMGRDSFRAYLRETFAGTDPVRQFGIASFDAVDLPRFDPVYWPRDAYGIVKDPLLQAWARWRSKVVSDFVAAARDRVHSLAPATTFVVSAGCDSLRANHLFASGVDLAERLRSADGVSMEESGWRPGVVDSAGVRTTIVMDERVAAADEPAADAEFRVATDARFVKIRVGRGLDVGGGFWGETDRDGKLVAMAHNMAFCNRADDIGLIGPLAASRHMLDDIADAIAWSGEHGEVLAGRDEPVAPVAVWRGLSTWGFIRHRPVWEMCAVEQMLFENHVPFTIVLDDDLERFCRSGRVLVLPGIACVSDEQVATITRFVEAGGGLLLLGQSGTRDERTRLRRRYAFETLFGGNLPDLEFNGPPHWVPTLDFSAMPPALSGAAGEGQVRLVRDIVPPRPLDVTRDVYMPERHVQPKDVVPPANEADILAALDDLLGGQAPRVTGPRWTLCEYWRRGRDLLICLANLRIGRDGGPVTIDLGPYRTDTARGHWLLEQKARPLQIRDGTIRLESVERFCAVELIGVF